VLTVYFAQTGMLRIEAVLAAAACATLSIAQRVLSTPVRRLRRDVVRVRGELEVQGGGTEPLDADVLRAAPEGGLRWMALAMPLLAAALLTARLV
jgi:hypothetical protein